MLPFRTFKDRAGAADLAAWLQQHGIPATTEDTSQSFEPSITHSVLNQDYTVKIPPEDFTRATAALREYYTTQLPGIPADYYLFSFTDAELTRILKAPDEWGDLDYVLARHLLAQRGHEVSDATLESYNESRIAELAMPDTDQGEQHIAPAIRNNRFGNLQRSLFVFTGPLGIIVGWHLARSRKTLPDGTTLFSYSNAVRARGRRIMWVSAVFTVILVIVRLLHS